MTTLPSALPGIIIIISISITVRATHTHHSDVFKRAHLQFTNCLVQEGILWQVTQLQQQHPLVTQNTSLNTVYTQHKLISTIFTLHPYFSSSVLSAILNWTRCCTNGT